VHAVVNLITAVNIFTGQPYDHGREKGAELKAAALQGMHRSDLFIYDGHGRYGTGPDFDRNWWITVNWDRYTEVYKKAVTRDGKLRAGKEDIVDAHEIHYAEEDLGLHGSDPIKRFKGLEEKGVMEFHAVGTGNIGINTEPNEMSLHGWLQGRSIASTKDELASSFKGDKERDYRLWLFNGCNTFNYEKRIRESGDALSSKKLDMFLTQNTISGTTTAEALLSYLDGVIARESAKALEGRLEEAQVSEKAPYGQYGFEDNPGAPPAKVKRKAKCSTSACQL